MDEKPIIYTSLSSDELRNEPIWQANLTNGLTAHHKHEQKAWLQLKSWLRVNPDVFIKDLYFRFRDNFVHIASDSDAYFFSHGVQCWYGASSEALFIGGSFRDGLIHRKTYKIPELVHQEDRDDFYEIDNSKIELGLIRWNKNIH
jgi:hypothetical protein